MTNERDVSILFTFLPVLLLATSAASSSRKMTLTASLSIFGKQDLVLMVKLSKTSRLTKFLE